MMYTNMLNTESPALHEQVQRSTAHRLLLIVMAFIQIPCHTVWSILLLLTQSSSLHKNALLAHYSRLAYQHAAMAFVQLCWKSQ